MRRRSRHPLLIALRKRRTQGDQFRDAVLYRRERRRLERYHAQLAPYLPAPDDPLPTATAPPCCAFNDEAEEDSDGD